MRGFQLGLVIAACMGFAGMGRHVRAQTAQDNKPKTGQGAGTQAEATSAPHANVAVFDIVCRYKNQTIGLHGKTIRRDDMPANAARGNNFTTAYRMDALNDLDYQFPSGLCADLCGYFNPFSVRPQDSKDVSRVKTLPSETIDGVTYSVVEMLNPEAPPAPPFGRGVPTLPRVRLRWYLAPDGQTRRMVGEFQLFKPDGKTLDPDPIVMDAAFTIREPQGSPRRAASGPLLRSLNIVNEDNGAVLALSASSAAPVLATADNLGAITIWDVNTAKPISTLSAQAGWQQALALSANGRRLAIVTGNESLCVWDIASGRPAQPPNVRWWGGSSLALSPDGSLVAVSTDPNSVFVWNVATGKAVTKLENVEGDHLMFSPDGKMLAARSRNTVGLWNTATWQEEAALSLTGFAPDGASGGNSLAFSPDSRLLAVGDQHWEAQTTGFMTDAQRPQPQSEMSVQIWDVRTRQRVQALKDATGPVLALAFSPDGKTLAVVDRDMGAEGPGHNSAVLLWDTQSWKQVSTLAVDHGKRIEHMAWTSDSAIIVTSCRDSALKFWPVPKR